MDFINGRFQPIVCGDKDLQVTCDGCGRWSPKIGTYVDRETKKRYHRDCIPFADDGGPRYRVVPCPDYGRPYAVVDYIRDIVISKHHSQVGAEQRCATFNEPRHTHSATQPAEVTCEHPSHQEAR